MAEASSSLSWCIVRLGEDMNWWVKETSDPVHWDADALSMIDPRQVTYLLELCEPLRDYGFDLDVFDNAFYTFRVDKEMDEGLIRLSRYRDSILGTDEKLFGLPDLLDEDKSPYAELLDEMMRCRVKLLNETIEFEQPLTVDEVEEFLNDRAGVDYAEGRALHIFNEMLTILEYVPDGYEDEVETCEETASPAKTKDATLDDIPDIEEEDMEEDETMKWDDDEEGEEDEEKEDMGGYECEEDEEEDTDEEEKKPAKKPASKKKKK
jgi:hypothetical protein